MIDGLASRVGAAQSTTGIVTLVPNACQIEGAFGANGAFGATIWRTAQEGGQTSADARIVHHAAIAVGSTR